ncbi:hypothetical protein AGMMS49936_01770 [Endomicrobiia bacterium]|nr:hypothetical protein AGMMS49936_01770 [Endomicrobiia bacterium]
MADIAIVFEEDDGVDKIRKITVVAGAGEGVKGHEKCFTIIKTLSAGGV